jgi:hypothetical protein
LGGLLRHYLSTLCGLAWTAALSVIAVAGLTVGVTRPALAEFEIQESQVEKGEVEIDYRGATHWGFPKGEQEEAAQGGAGVLQEEEQGDFLRQSHDFEPQFGMTDRWLLSFTLTADEPLDSDFNISAVEIENQYELIEREGDGFGLAFAGAYGFATRGGEADETEFGPIAEFALGNLLVTSNTYLTAQVGSDRETSGLGFDYGWRAEYAVAPRWSLGVEMFGEIDDLSKAGPFNDQSHSIGPTLFYYPGGHEDEDGDDEDYDDDEMAVAGRPEMEFFMNVGLQFGLTDSTSDTALKFQGTLGF